MTWLLFLVVGCVMIYHYLSHFHGIDLFKRRSGYQIPRKRSSLPADAESQYLLCTFSIAAKVIAADGAVTDKEKERLSVFMKDALSLSEKEEQLAWRVFDKAISSDLEIRDYAEAFRRYFPDRVQLTDKVVVTLLDIASSDGFVHPKEERAIRTTAILLGISAPAYERLKSEHLSNDDQYH